VIPAQSAISCLLELAQRANQQQHPIDAGKVVVIEAEVTRMTYDFTGGGLYGMDKVVQTKEQADQGAGGPQPAVLPYLLAVALLDREVLPAQFAPERIARIARPDVQTLLRTVAVRPNQEYTEVCPRQMPAKITVRLQDGTTYEHEVRAYLGMPSPPSPGRTRPRNLIASSPDAWTRRCPGRSRRRCVRLEGIQVKDLLALLSRVQVVRAAH
jgi:2-methylcitrate dehydratase